MLYNEMKLKLPLYNHNQVCIFNHKILPFNCIVRSYGKIQQVYYYGLIPILLKYQMVVYK